MTVTALHKNNQQTRRTTGDVDFFRNWTDYKNGFGSPPGDFWLGNDAIHELTQKNAHELRIDLQADGRDLFAHYSWFIVNDEADGYRLQLGTPSGTLGHSPILGMAYNNGQKFSTKDRDNDVFADRNCAELYHGAWWYKDCTFVNLNGNWWYSKYRDARGMMWNSGSGLIHADSTEMKIRRL
ncbi:ficolin-2 [Elysia marginata]|uniref:Ficolin-2 n=1 Tax=Elysia marginata TaxID=1093978 RepID=A0AAV4G388_9GAST|nr:ficolin-2 [Elysia marginata]